MSTAEITHFLASPNLRTKFVVAYYVLTIFTGAFLLFFHGRMAGQSLGDLAEQRR